VPLDPDSLPRVFSPTAPYEVGREKIREFADSLGDDNPVYRDPDAARAAGHPDVIAPPTFPSSLAMTAFQEVMAGLGFDNSRVFHATLRFSSSRPARVGDRLVVQVSVQDTGLVGGNTSLDVEANVRTAEDEPVAVVFAKMIAVPED
jgi:acyl dehydratase